MDKSTITSELAERLMNQRVIASVFTTYNFEPEFFELDVIPELLAPSIPYSADERVKLFQVREALRESGLKLDVFYDLPIFRQSADRSPQMEYLCHGVHMGNAAFHAKNIYLLVENKENSQQSLLVASGSNNITRAGWWNNVEVQHWEEIISGEVQRAFLNRIKEDIVWLKAKIKIQTSATMTLIENFLNSCRGSNAADPVHYFPLRSNKLFSFLNTLNGKPIDQYQNWSMEIISPYFPDNAKSNLHSKFFSSFGIKNITLFLPRNQDGEALCHSEYYEYINESENIDWGEWHDDMKKALAMNDQPFRTTHAKIYHFYNGRQSWVFVGSVNFTYKAINENIESGYFVRHGGRGKPFLQQLEPDAVENFLHPSDEESGVKAPETGNTLPELHISYDWVSKELTGRTGKENTYDVQFLNAENNPVLAKSHFQIFGLS